MSILIDFSQIVYCFTILFIGFAHILGFVENPEGSGASAVLAIVWTIGDRYRWGWHRKLWVSGWQPAVALMVIWYHRQEWRLVNPTQMLILGIICCAVTICNNTLIHSASLVPQKPHHSCDLPLDLNTFIFQPNCIEEKWVWAQV